MIEVPLTSDPNQVVTITLGGTEYELSVFWGEVRQCWTLGITRTSDQAQLLVGASLFLGVDILESFGQLGIGSMVLVDTSGRDEEATAEDGDLGERVKLYYFSQDEA